jgi:Protein of unknown function (DUF1572)
MNKYKELYLNYLTQLKDEMSSYKKETDIWKLAGSITNSPGNLAMHLCGNLKYNFGTLILKNGYIRHRDYEFSQKNTPKQLILNEIELTRKVVTDAFDSMGESDLTREFPSDIYDEGQSIGSVLLRLAFHFAYHLGQINYHRRLIS